MSAQSIIALKGEAETATIYVERVRLAQDAAREAVDAARAQVEVARLHVEAMRGLKTQADAALDEVLARAEGLGVNKKAFRAVVERSVEDLKGLGMIQVTPFYGDDAAIFVSDSDATPRIKAPRAVRSRQTAAFENTAAETEVATSPGVESTAEASTVVSEEAIEVVETPQVDAIAVLAAVAIVLPEPEPVLVADPELASPDVVEEAIAVEVIANVAEPSNPPVSSEEPVAAAPAPAPVSAPTPAPAFLGQQGGVRSKPPSFLTAPRPPAPPARPAPTV